MNVPVWIHEEGFSKTQFLPTGREDVQFVVTAMEEKEYWVPVIESVTRAGKLVQRKELMGGAWTPDGALVYAMAFVNSNYEWIVKGLTL